MNNTAMPQVMIARVSGNKLQTRRPKIVAMIQQTTLNNVPISNAPTKSGAQKCLTGLAYPECEFRPERFGVGSVIL
jgi:hypothetical protein